MPGEELTLDFSLFRALVFAQVGVAEPALDRLPP